LLRCDYERSMHTAPGAHRQVSAERGAFSQLLARAGHKTPHDLGSLHLPVGGHRFRPCLEDFLQFLIQECMIDHRRYWRKAVEDGRQRWRLRQAGAVARDTPKVAVRVLTELGYEIKSPKSGHATTNIKALRNW
jgi:hypothetical protein